MFKFKLFNKNSTNNALKKDSIFINGSNYSVKIEKNNDHFTFNFCLKDNEIFKKIASRAFDLNESISEESGDENQFTYKKVSETDILVSVKATYLEKLLDNLKHINFISAKNKENILDMVTQYTPSCNIL